MRQDWKFAYGDARSMKRMDIDQREAFVSAMHPDAARLVIIAWNLVNSNRWASY
jgi:hypothetical protein